MKIKQKYLENFSKKVTEDKEYWDKERPLLETQKQIRNERKEIIKSKIKLPSYSKLFLIFLLINFTALEIFTGWVTVESFRLAFETAGTPDFTPLITLMSAVIGETISYGIYCSKSKAENTIGGVVHDLAMNQMDDE